MKSSFPRIAAAGGQALSCRNLSWVDCWQSHTYIHTYIHSVILRKELIFHTSIYDLHRSIYLYTVSFLDLTSVSAFIHIKLKVQYKLVFYMNIWAVGAKIFKSNQSGAAQGSFLQHKKIYEGIPFKGKRKVNWPFFHSLWIWIPYYVIL